MILLFVRDVIKFLLFIVVMVEFDDLNRILLFLIVIGNGVVLIFILLLVISECVLIDGIRLIFGLVVILRVIEFCVLENLCDVLILIVVWLLFNVFNKFVLVINKVFGVFVLNLKWLFLSL